jgi:predicted dehydrogenase
LCFFADKRVKEVIAVSSKNREDFDQPTTYTIIMKFENGSTGKVFFTYDTRHPYIYNIQIFGEKGTIRNDMLYSKPFFPGLTDWIKIASIMPDTENVKHHPFPELVDHFADCILKDLEAHPSVRDVTHAFEIIEAAERSAEKGSTSVKIPFE